MTIVKETSPHIHRKDSLARMLIDVLVALSPVSITALVVYGLPAMRNLLLGVSTMMLCEFVFVLITNRIPYDGTKHTLKEQFLHGCKAMRIHHILAPIVSGVIFALIMPSHSDPAYIIYIALVLGAIFGIVIGKLVFGGTGQNIFNPAAAGMVFAKLCFGSKYVYGTTPFVNAVQTGGTLLGDVASSSTSLLGRYATIGDYSALDMFLGRIPGTIGEGFKFAILIGLIYLLIRRAADYRVIVSYLGGYAAIMAIAGIFVVTKVSGVNYGQWMLYSLLTGGVLFGATYMLTDPVTMPINAPGRVMYGLLAAGLTAIIRLFGALPEGVAFSILIANLAAPAFDYYSYSGNRFTKKKIIFICGMAAAFVLAVCLGLGFQEVTA
ncbi:MAG: RnfABCDGE type electron transport complex subunit D [Bacilli bacterium]|nr:RnfABCDGE type electron transport complex subunit D [Bacilli bacterium]